MRYAAWWVRVWSLAAAVGIGLAILEWSAPVTVVVVVVTSLLMSVAVTMATQPRVTALEPGWGWRRVLVRSTAGGVGLVGLLALLAASPPLALLALLLVLATCPPAARRLRRPTGRLTTGPAEPRPPRATLGVQDLGDHELCMMWRRTFWDLRTHHTLAGLATTVSLRQACLDELEHRNPPQCEPGWNPEPQPPEDRSGSGAPRPAQTAPPEDRGRAGVRGCFSDVHLHADAWMHERAKVRVCCGSWWAWSCG